MSDSLLSSLSNLAYTLTYHSACTLSVATASFINNTEISSWRDTFNEILNHSIQEKSHSANICTSYFSSLHEVISPFFILNGLYNTFNMIKRNAGDIPNDCNIIEAASFVMMNTLIETYALPTTAHVGAKLISHATGIDAQLLNIPVYVITQRLYVDVANAFLLYLANSKDELDQTGLIRAARYNRLQEIKTFIQVGAKLNEQDNDGCTALIKAACHGHINIAKALIQAGAQLDLQENFNIKTALIYAAEYGHTEIATALIQAGAQLDLQNSEGNTALISAIERGHTGIATALIQAGAQLNLKNTKGNTALMCAIERNRTGIATALIQAGAQLNLQNTEGNTALMLCASKYGFTDTVKALIQAGADISILNNTGRSALSLAGYDDNAFSILNAMKLIEIDAAIQTFPNLVQVVSRFKEEIRKIQDNIFYRLRALVQNTPKIGSDIGSNLVNLPFELKTLILSKADDYPKWYGPKESDVFIQSGRVAKMIRNKQDSDDQLVADKRSLFKYYKESSFSFPKCRVISS